jgi:osmoprotectant transport system ATP-binding protein
MYQYRSSWMPVLDADGHYVGEVTQDSIADYLSSGRSRQQTGQLPTARTKETAGA